MPEDDLILSDDGKPVESYVDPIFPEEEPPIFGPAFQMIWPAGDFPLV